MRGPFPQKSAKAGGATWGVFVVASTVGMIVAPYLAVRGIGLVIPKTVKA